MKKIINIILAAAVLGGLWACQDPAQQQEVTGSVDLRYRVQDSYSLPSSGAQTITILVSSTDPWMVYSEHPDWCIIDVEEGGGQEAALVHDGKAEVTTIRVQYYDNTDLDDRTDHIYIATETWLGKTVTVTQKGCAYLTVPEEDLAQDVAKAGGDFTVHVLSNQNWSAKVTDGDWVSVGADSNGNGDGAFTVTAVENTSELRYAEVTVLDRHSTPMYYVKFTQDGVQLVPAATEIRAGFDQLSAELEIVANSKWEIAKASDTDTWFTIDTPTGDGNGTIKLTLEPNPGTTMRVSSIIVKNVKNNEDDAQVEKEITVKQAYEITPVRHIVDNDELSLWKSDQAQTPTYTKDVGTLFPAVSRLNRSMEFGSYTFRWSSISPGARVRHWFCFSDGIEIKADIRPASAKVSFDFNASSSGVSTKPSVDAYTAVDFTQPVELTYKFDPSGANHCHVTFLINGAEAGSFDTSDEILHTVTWGASINMYFGVYEEGEGSSAICEWYEYTAPMNWGD